LKLEFVFNFVFGRTTKLCKYNPPVATLEISVCLVLLKITEYEPPAPSTNAVLYGCNTLVPILSSLPVIVIFPIGSEGTATPAIYAESQSVPTALAAEPSPAG
jgi:hypothetical protein